MSFARRVALLSLLVALVGISARADIVGSIFLTGHDPDFHAFLGGNATGARDITNTAINFITDPAFNTFAAGGVHKFMYVTSDIAPPAGYIDGTQGIIASGYVEGTDFDEVNAAGLNAALNNLGTTYDAIVVASDFGGILTQAELDILDARSADIINFLNAGGGIYAMAESGIGGGANLTASGQFGFLPFIVSSAALNQRATLRCRPCFRACRGARGQSYPQRRPRGSQTWGESRATAERSRRAQTHVGQHCAPCRRRERRPPRERPYRAEVSTSHL